MTDELLECIYSLLRRTSFYIPYFTYSEIGNEHKRIYNTGHGMDFCKGVSNTMIRNRLNLLAGNGTLTKGNDGLFSLSDKTKVAARLEGKI